MLLSSVNLSISLSELNWVPGYPLAGKHVKASTSTHAHTRTVFYSSKSMCWHISTLFHGSAHTRRHYTPQRLIITQVCHLVFIWASENLPPLTASPFYHLPSVFSSPPLFHPFHHLSRSSSLSRPPWLYCWDWSFAGCVQCQTKGVLKCGFLTGRFYWRRTGHVVRRSISDVAATLKWLCCDNKPMAQCFYQTVYQTVHCSQQDHSVHSSAGRTKLLPFKSPRPSRYSSKCVGMVRRVFKILTRK